MEKHRPQFSLATFLLALTALAVVFTCLRAETTRMYVVPLVVSFSSGLLFPYGIRIGFGASAIVIIINAILMEKDPSGLGPNEIVIPFHLAVFALPVLVAAWFGSILRDQMSI